MPLVSMTDSAPNYTAKTGVSAQHPTTVLDPGPHIDTKAKLDTGDTARGVSTPSPVTRQDGDSPSVAASAASKKRKKVPGPPPHLRTPTAPAALPHATPRRALPVIPRAA